MKKILFFSLALLMMVLNACGGSSLEPLEGNPELSTFTELSEDGKTVLTGVAQTISGKIVLKPDIYDNLSADEYTITETKPKETIAFKTNGEKIGRFEMFTRWDKYYLGVKYKAKTFYFPKTDEIVSTTIAHNELELLFIRVRTGFDIRNFEGDILWQAPIAFWLIKDQNIPTQIYIAVEEKGHTPSCTLYTPKGIVYKTLSPKTWKKLKDKLHLITNLTEDVHITDTNNFSLI